MCFEVLCGGGDCLNVETRSRERGWVGRKLFSSSEIKERERKEK